MDKKKKLLRINSTRTLSSISKIKVKYNYPLGIGEYSTTKIKNRIKEILTSISTYNKKLNTTTNKLIKEEYVKNAKENIIISLHEDLAYHKKINRHYLLYKQYTKDIFNYFKQNYEEINKYKKNLCHDLSDFINVMKNYDQKIKQLKKDKDIIINTNNDIIKYKLNEKEKMKEKIDILNIDLEKQKINLNEINNILNEYKSQNENYIKDLNNNELNHMEQYEILEENYKKLKSQYEFYYNKETKTKKFELDSKNNNLFKDEREKVNLILQDNIIKNIFLKEIANDIKEQINKIENVNHRNSKDEALFKFLGKTFYNKVTKRKSEANNNIKIIDYENKTKNINKIHINIKINGSKSRLKNKYKTMRNKYGLNLIINQTNYKNYDKINQFNKTNNTHNMTTFYIGNNLKETSFSSNKNTKNNRMNFTTTRSI